MSDENLRAELERLKSQLDQKLQEVLRQSEARLTETQEKIAKIESLAMGTIETLEDRHWKDVRALVEKERKNSDDSARAFEEMRQKLSEQQRAIASELGELAKHRDALKKQAAEQLSDQSIVELERRRVRELQDEAAKLRADRDVDGELLRKERRRIIELEERVKSLSTRSQELEEQFKNQIDFVVPPDSPVRDLMSSYADHLQSIQSLSEIGGSSSAVKILPHIQALSRLGAALEKSAAAPKPVEQPPATPVPPPVEAPKEEPATMSAGEKSAVDIREILQQHAENMERISQIHAKQINQLTEQIQKQKDTIKDLSERIKSKP